MKKVFLILACDDTTVKKGGSVSAMRLLKHASLDQPTVDSEGFSRGTSVAVTAPQWHFNGTSTELPRGKKIMVSMILSTPFEIVDVSRMLDFCFKVNRKFVFTG